MVTDSAGGAPGGEVGQRAHLRASAGSDRDHSRARTGWSLRAALSSAHLLRSAGRECEAAAVLAPPSLESSMVRGTRDFEMQRNWCCSYLLFTFKQASEL
jgi:hypothetical protein